MIATTRDIWNQKLPAPHIALIGMRNGKHVTAAKAKHRII